MNSGHHRYRGTRTRDSIVAPRAPGDAPRPRNPTPDNPGAGPLVIVAGRLPLDAVEGPGGTSTWVPAPGGLATALSSVLPSYDSTWVGWPGAGGDTSTTAVPEQTNGIRLRSVPMTSDEYEQHYQGFCNATIWPLFHDAIVTPEFDRGTWEAYRRINARFAKAASEAAPEGATVWVHDYQLMLVPQMLRRERPDLTIGFFLHIPFPPRRLFMHLPWRAQIVDGLLGADLVGFHLEEDAHNFVRLACTLRGAFEREAGLVMSGSNHLTRVGAFPISVDAEAFVELAQDPAVQERAAAIRADLGNPRTVILGVDRLDYTKGIHLRLAAFRELLDDGLVSVDDTCYIQVAAPTREGVHGYEEIRVEIERLVGQAAGEHGRVGMVPIHYLHQNLPREELVALYLAADVMMVTPLRDGMNLVAKEYVVVKADAGALVLSEFTGAAEELTSAWLVNPYDGDAVKRALVEAITSSPYERRRRMMAMSEHVRTHDVHRWAQSYLSALAPGARRSVVVTRDPESSRNPIDRRAVPNG